MWCIIKQSDVASPGATDKTGIAIHKRLKRMGRKPL